MVALVAGRQEDQQPSATLKTGGGATPTRCRGFHSEMHPFDPALTGDRRAETLLTLSPPE
ncbi:hypothetical protein [Prochlorothrix hollandica]|uniref:hypothetical protein n=1 Tax=Prochlorothrix hollandica TaxID=1223 RepID=UPI00333F22AA